VTGLTPDTLYDFKVIVTNGINSADSNILTISTAINDPFFDPSNIIYSNLGDASSSSVVAFDDTTDIKLNGSTIATLNASQTHTFSSNLYDEITCDKPCYVSGTANSSTHVVWSPNFLAGNKFVFTFNRYANGTLRVYAFEDSTVEFKKGATVIDTQFITAGNDYTFTVNSYGGFQLESTGLIGAYIEGTATRDQRTLIPIGSYDLIGFPSGTAYASSISDGNSYAAFYGDGSVSGGTLNSGSYVTFSGTGSQYSGRALRITASDHIGANSNADGDGTKSAAFIPISFMRKKYVLSRTPEWVSFASVEAGSIDVYDSSNNFIVTLTLSRGGAGQTPYNARFVGGGPGWRFEADVPVGAWFEDQATDDESILFGFD
jgi:hypothetical protein